MPTRSEYQSYLSLPQVKATLDTIAWAEGANYNTLFGGGTFQTGGPHPNRRIPFRNTYSTAAGRYQFLYSTWQSLGLPNMSPENQDIGALMLIQRRGALDEILAGDFAAALRSGALGKEWASLPYSPYGQTNRTESQVLNYYNGALSVYNGGGPLPTVNYSGNSANTGNSETNTALLYGLGLVLLILLIDG